MCVLCEVCRVCRAGGVCEQVDLKLELLSFWVVRKVMVESPSVVCVCVARPVSMSFVCRALAVADVVELVTVVLSGVSELCGVLCGVVVSVVKERVYGVFRGGDVDMVCITS